MSRRKHPKNKGKVKKNHETLKFSDNLASAFIPVTVILPECFILNFIYLFLAVLGLHCRTSFSLVAESVGYSLVVVESTIFYHTPLCGLLSVVGSLVAEHGLEE